VGYLQLTAHAGRRCSAVDAFLSPALRDPNLTLHTRAVATRLVFDGARATGVEYLQHGRTVTAHADRAVILTAGAFATPQLLMLSGIGPASELCRHGIDVRVDLPGVGRNLQDHHEVPVIAATNGAFGYFGQD